MLYTVTRHTAYYCGENQNGDPVFRTSSAAGRRAGHHPKIFTNRRTAQKVARGFFHLIGTSGHRPRVSKVRTVNNVLN
jgi:hypothetical protein